MPMISRIIAAMPRKKVAIVYSIPMDQKKMCRETTPHSEMIETILAAILKIRQYHKCILFA